MKNHYGKIVVATAAAMSSVATLALATTEAVVVDVAFADSIGITENNTLSFGLLSTAMVNTDVVAISTADAVTDTNSRVIGGTQQAADLTIAATASQAATILVNNVTDGTGYALATWLCKYDVGSEAACDGGGLGVTTVASGTLKIGVTLTGNGSDSAGADNGGFDVVITYD